MITAQVDALDVMDVWHQEHPTNRGRMALPIHAGTGAASTTVAYLELDPGVHAGSHTDSAEETFFVLEGEAEIVAENERARLRAGGLAVAGTMVPHDIVNVGRGVLKLILFFTSAAVVTEHEDVVAPMGLRVFTLGGPQPEEAGALSA